MMVRKIMFQSMVVSIAVILWTAMWKEASGVYEYRLMKGEDVFSS